MLTDGYYGYKMDVWGLGCVMFEITSLFPLFPGNNEADQVHKIHNVLGTPAKSALKHFRRCTKSINLNFPCKQGTGIERLIPHASPECIDAISNSQAHPIEQMLVYDPDLRITARKAMKLPFFKPLHDQDERRYNRIEKDFNPRVPITQLPKNPDNPNSSKNLDDTTGTEQNNLSDYHVSHRSSKKGHKDISTSFLLTDRKSHKCF